MRENIDLLQTEIRNSLGTRSKIPVRYPKIAAETPREGACFRKVLSAFFFSVRLASAAEALAGPACSQESCSTVRATQVVECSTSKQLP